MNKYAILGPGFNLVVTSMLDYKDFSDKILLELSMKNCLVLEPADTVGNTLYFYPSKGQHFHLCIMTEKAWNDYRREQMFAATKQAQGIRQ